MARADGRTIYHNRRMQTMSARTELEKGLDGFVAAIGLMSGTSLDGIDDALLAFDAGPGNAMLDDWAAAHVDPDGALAGAGRPAVPAHPLTSSSLTISK